MQTHRVALVQMQCWEDRKRNVETACSQVARAAEVGATVVCLQELFNTVYFCHEEDASNFRLAETIPGPTTATLGRTAQSCGVTIVAPLFERTDSEYYNSAAVIRPDGTIAGTYRKSSIPLSTLSDWTSREKYYFKPGNTGFPVFDTPGGLRVGVLICYDRHFPEAARVLALRGADIILIPTATGGPARRSWEVELQGMAVSNVLYVGGVNRVGHDDGDLRRPKYFGASVFCSYDGTVLAIAGEEIDDVIYVDIDLAAMSTARQALGWYRDRRPDLYADLVR